MYDAYITMIKILPNHVYNVNMHFEFSEYINIIIGTLITCVPAYLQL